MSAIGIADIQLRHFEKFTLIAVTRRYSFRSVIHPVHQKLTKKIAAFGNLCWFTGKLEPVLTKHTTLIQHIFLACDEENGGNFQTDSGTERFADSMAR
jgi:hypothetical protein